MAGAGSWIDEQREWRALSACRRLPTKWFFAPPGEDEDEYRYNPLAHAACTVCPVHDECLSHAIKHEPHGMWANTTPGQRHKIRKVSRIKMKNLGAIVRTRGKSYDGNQQPDGETDEPEPDDDWRSWVGREGRGVAR